MKNTHKNKWETTNPTLPSPRKSPTIFLSIYKISIYLYLAINFEAINRAIRETTNPTLPNP